jgi:hypothetical protein
MDASPRRDAFIALLVMCLAVAAVYVPVPESPGDNTQRGGDFHVVHARRIAFARENLAERGAVPGWFPRELMGQPFWANAQSFPFLPTRLALLALPPNAMFTAGVMTGAILAAVFTFGYARAIGLSPLGAAAAGWTFACAGFFASRVISGQLPLLEAYPALPLLMWLVELNVGPRRGVAAAAAPPRGWVRLGALAVASTCVALAGHPQLGVYAFAVAGLYLLWRGRTDLRRAATAAAAMGLGWRVRRSRSCRWRCSWVAARARSSWRAARPTSSTLRPPGRLAAAVEGWVAAGRAPAQRPGVHRVPNDTYFYDTVTYGGWLPLIAAAFLAAVWIARRRRPAGVAVFLAVAGAAALVTALPAFHAPGGAASFTFLRSPSRQTYVTTFALALALGAGLDVLRRAATARAAARLGPRGWRRCCSWCTGWTSAGTAGRSSARRTSRPTRRASPRRRWPAWRATSGWP